MTVRLRDALSRCRHLRGDRVLYADDGRELTNKVVRRWSERVQKKAGLIVNGRMHQLRSRGAPIKAIQELAGHEHLSTTCNTCILHLPRVKRPSGYSTSRKPSPTAPIAVAVESWGRRRQNLSKLLEKVVEAPGIEGRLSRSHLCLTLLHSVRLTHVRQ
jgi:hypothetical protein